MAPRVPRKPVGVPLPRAGGNVGPDYPAKPCCNPVPDAVIFISNGAGDVSTFQSGAGTDFNGTYEAGVPSGELNYMIIATGYQLEFGTIDITQEWNWFNFTLTPIATPVKLMGYIRDLDLGPLGGQEMTIASTDDWMGWLVANNSGYFEVKILERGDSGLEMVLKSMAKA